MKKLYVPIVLMALLMAACGGSPQPLRQTEAVSNRENLPGDSALYGLACDGSTDSMLVLLPFAGGNPDTLNIIRAHEEHRIYGRPRIGDEMAVIFASDSTREVLLAVNISRLHGQWCYMAYPTPRHHLTHPSRPIPDSVQKRIMTPLEYVLRLNHDGTARASGQPRNQTSDDRRPVDYPVQKRYAQWRLYNGSIILIPDTGSRQSPDTATIQLLRRDTLVLRFRDREQGYYRKVDSTNVVLR